MPKAIETILKKVYMSRGARRTNYPLLRSVGMPNPSHLCFRDMSHGLESNKHGCLGVRSREGELEAVG